MSTFTAQERELLKLSDPAWRDTPRKRPSKPRIRFLTPFAVCPVCNGSLISCSKHRCHVCHAKAMRERRKRYRAQRMAAKLLVTLRDFRWVDGTCQVCRRFDHSPGCEVAQLMHILQERER